MANAARRTPTGMSAVIGADEDELLAQLRGLNLEPANFNGAKQIVVAGDLDALGELTSNPPACARVIPLRVAGAFHTRYMDTALPILRECAESIRPNDPASPLWTNKDGSQIASGSDFLELLVGQLVSPVRWDRCMESFAAAGITGLIELPPSGRCRVLRNARSPIFRSCRSKLLTTFTQHGIFCKHDDT